MQVYGQAILSSFALLEGACATGRAAAEDGAGRVLVLTGACFGPYSPPGGAMQCLLHPRSGAVQLSSTHASGAGSAQHLSGALAAVMERPASRSSSVGSHVSHTILVVVRVALQLARAAESSTAAFCSIAEPGSAQGGFWMHPAAAEAAAALQTVMLGNPASWRPCRALRPASCSAVLCHSRQAASRKLHASLSGCRRRRRGRRAAASLAVQLCDGQAGFEVASLEHADALPLAAVEATYITMWQRVPEPAHTRPARCAACQHVCSANLLHVEIQVIPYPCMQNCKVARCEPRGAAVVRALPQQ